MEELKLEEVHAFLKEHQHFFSQPIKGFVSHFKTHKQKAAKGEMFAAIHVEHKIAYFAAFAIGLLWFKNYSAFIRSRKKAISFMWK